MKKKDNLGLLIPVFATFYVMGFVDMVGMATGYINKLSSLIVLSVTGGLLFLRLWVF